MKARMRKSVSLTSTERRQLMTLRRIRMMMNFLHSLPSLEATPEERESAATRLKSQVLKEADTLGKEIRIALRASFDNRDVWEELKASIFDQ